MPSEHDWACDRDRFVTDAAQAAPLRDHGAPLGPLAQQFATLTCSLLNADTVGEVLRQLVHAAHDVIAGADLASVTLRTPDGQFFTPVQTDEVATELDQVQYQLDEGPCLTAADPNGPALALSDDLATESQWPRFAPVAAQRGYASLCATALQLTGQQPQLSGSLNLYSRKPGGFTAEDQAVALLLATHASLALAHTRTVEMAELQARQLHRAIDSRDVIGQAKGILMARRGCSAAEAFDLLRTTSQELNVKLVQLAETLTTRHHDLDPPTADQ